MAEIGDIKAVTDQVEKRVDRFDQNPVQTPVYYQVLDVSGQVEKEEGRQGIGEEVHPVKQEHFIRGPPVQLMKGIHQQPGGEKTRAVTEELCHHPGEERPPVRDD